MARRLPPAEGSEFGVRLTMEIAVTVALFGLLLAIAAYDALQLRIPDVANLSLLLGGLAAGEVLHRASPVTGLVSAALAFAAMWLVREGYLLLRGRQGLGLGDVKFVAAGAAWVGLEGVPSLVLCASACALLTVGAVVSSGRAVARLDRWPFGPFLAIGLMAVWVVGPFDAWIGRLLFSP